MRQSSAKFLMFVVAVFLLASCGENTETKIIELEKKINTPFYIDKVKVDSQLLPHVMEFAGYCERFKISELCQKNFNNTLSVRLVPSFKEKNVVGKCFVDFYTGKRWVEVLDWKDYESLLTKTLVMHEMGHCVLGDPYPHFDNDYDIMNSYLLPQKIIQMYWPILIQNMFLRVGGSLLTEDIKDSNVSSVILDEFGNFSCEKEKF